MGLSIPRAFCFVAERMIRIEAIPCDRAHRGESFLFHTKQRNEAIICIWCTYDWRPGVVFPLLRWRYSMQYRPNGEPISITSSVKKTKQIECPCWIAFRDRSNTFQLYYVLFCFFPHVYQVISPIFQNMPRLPSPMGTFLYPSFLRLPWSDRLTALGVLARCVISRVQRVLVVKATLLG